MSTTAEIDTRAVADTAAQAIGAAVERHGRIALMYSGGIESALLLCLAEPWRERVKVYHGRTGAEFPHMATFVDHALEGWDHRIITGDLAASFRDFGIPASVLPIEHVQGFSESLKTAERRPLIAPWPMCCSRNRSMPVYEAIKQDRIGVAVHGQRKGDWTGRDTTVTPLTHAELELVAPLWTVSRATVGKLTEALGIELPAHYSEYPSSLDCAVCPSSLTTKRRAYMAKHYPQHLATAEALHGAVREAVAAALNGDNTENARVIV